MQKELSLVELLKVFKRTWWKMLLIALAFMVIAALYTHYMVPDRFSSTVNFYIRNEQNNTDYINPTLLSASDNLANNYISIIKGDRCMLEIKTALEDQGIYRSTNEIKSMLSFSKDTDTSTFLLRVSGTNAYEAYVIATLIAQKAPDIITETAKLNSNTEIYGTLVDIDIANAEVRDAILGHYASIRVDKTPCVEVLNGPVEDTVADSPSIARNMALTGIIAAILTYAIALLLSMMDTAIRTEEDLKNCIDVPVLGVIPSWAADRKDKYYDRYKHYSVSGKEDSKKK